MEFVTKYNYEPTKGVEMSDELITEQTGYRTTEEIVEGMILAGQRLEDYRHGRLDEYLEDSYQEPIERYEKDPVEEEEDIVRKLRYRSVKNAKVDEERSQEVSDKQSVPQEERNDRIQEEMAQDKASSVNYPPPGSDGMKSGMNTGF